MNLTHLIDHRISLQDPQSGATYHGWVDETSQTIIVVQGVGSSPPSGAVLKCRVAHKQATASFTAVCVHSLGSDFAVNVVGEIAAEALHEDPRFRIDLDADMYVGETKATVRVTDISLNGVGFISPQRHDRGSNVDLVFHDFGSIRVTGTVRYCAPREDGFGFKVGTELVTVGRLERSRWRRLLQHGDPVLLSLKLASDAEAA